MIASIVKFDFILFLHKQLDEGDVVGHRIIDLETSRKIAAAAAAGQAGRPVMQDSSAPTHSRQHLASDFQGRDRSIAVRTLQK